MIPIGMIGAGRWGGNWIRTLANLPGVELRWVCDVSQASLEKVQKQYPNVRVTTKVDDLINDKTLAGAVVASIAPTHFDVASKLLEAGKDVMVEKPMTLTTADAQKLVAIAKAKSRVLMVGHLLEYHPIIRRIKTMIVSGELGDVLYLYCQRLNLGTVRSDENAWWSLAPHDISVCCRLLGANPVSVQCRGQSIVHPNVEDVVFATLEFPGNRLAHVHVSWLDPHKARKLVVVGSARSVVFDDAAEHKLIVHDKGFTRAPTELGKPDVVTLKNGEVTMPKIDAGEPLGLEAAHFIECIRERKAPISDGPAGLINVAVLEYGQRSLEQGGAVVPIPPLV
ncbi:MAG: Gfo/Idh/MocA family oxidoreductase [Gemmataceae bacterium]